MAPPRYARAKSVKLTQLRATITFFWRGGSVIRQVLPKCGFMLYHICENEPKIPVLTFISDLQGKTVPRGGKAKGGQGWPPKRQIRQVKPTPGGRKKGAKSILGSNPFRKVALEIFPFSACTLMFTKRGFQVILLKN